MGPDILDSLSYFFGVFVEEPHKKKKSLHPKNVFLNGDYTTVVWDDGTHTVVKRAGDDNYDLEKAILFAIVKKCADNNTSTVKRYLQEFFDVSYAKRLKPKHQKTTFVDIWEDTDENN